MSVIVEVEIGRLELLLEDSHLREQAHGSAFNFRSEVSAESLRRSPSKKAPVTLAHHILA